jgi:hypothetical protein
MRFFIICQLFLLLVVGSTFAAPIPGSSDISLYKRSPDFFNRLKQKLLPNRSAGAGAGAAGTSTGAGTIAGAAAGAGTGTGTGAPPRPVSMTKVISNSADVPSRDLFADSGTYVLYQGQ